MVNCPDGAISVRDLIRDMLRSQADTNSSNDTGGGFGSADLWMSFGGDEYYICVQPTKKG